MFPILYKVAKLAGVSELVPVIFTLTLLWAFSVYLIFKRPALSKSTQKEIEIGKHVIPEYGKEIRRSNASERNPGVARVIVPAAFMVGGFLLLRLWAALEYSTAVYVFSVLSMIAFVLLAVGIIYSLRKYAEFGIFQLLGLIIVLTFIGMRLYQLYVSFLPAIT